jgi:O-antigen ligase
MDKNAVSRWIDGIVLGLVVLLLVSMALLFTTKTTDTNLFKELSMVFLAPICFFAFMAKFLVKGRFKLTSSPMNVPVLVFLAIATVSFFTHPGLMFFSKFTYIKYLCFGGAFFLMASLIRTRAQLKIVLYTMAVMAFLCSVYGLMQKFPDHAKWLGFTYKLRSIPHFPILKGLIVWSNHPRTPSTFGNPNFFAAYIVLMTPVVFGMIAASKKIIGAILAGGVAAILTLCIVLTQTRGGWLGYAAGFLIYVLFFIFTVERDRVAHKPVFWICAAAFFIAATLYLSQNEIVSKRIKHTIANMQSGQGTVDSRSVFYKGSLNMFTARPVFGQGVGSFQMRFPFYRPNDYRMHRVSHNTRHSHSEYLQLLGEMGIIGLLAFLVVIGAAVKTTWRTFIVGKNRNHWLISIGLLMILLAFLAYVVVNPGMIITTLIGVTGLGLIFVTLLLSGKKTFCYAGDRYYRHIALGLFASIIGILVHNLVSVNLRWVEAGFFLWFNMGLLVAVARLEQEQRQAVTDKKSKDAPELEEKTFRLVPINNKYKIPAIAGFAALALVVMISFYWIYIKYYKSELARARGVIHLERSKNYRLAKKEFEESASYYHQNLSSRYKVAYVYGLLDNDLEKAYREYKIITQFSPHYSEIHYNLTSNCLSIARRAKNDKAKQQKFLVEAEDQAKMAVNIQASSKNHMLYVRVLLERGKDEEAEKRYRMAIEQALRERERGIRGMAKSEIVLEWASYMMSRKKHDKALKELEEVYGEYQEELSTILDGVVAGTNFSRNLVNPPLAGKAFKTLAVKSGLTEYQILQMAYKGIVDIGYRMSEIYRVQRQLPQAEKILDQLAAEYPNMGVVHFFRGRYFAVTGKRFKARSELQRALELDQKSRWVKDAKGLLERIEQNL